MPNTRVLMGGMGGRGSSLIRIVASGGNSMDLPIAPTGFTADGGANIAQLERQGLEALTRIDGPKKDTLSFTVTLGRVDWKRSIQTQVDWIERRKNEGRRIKLSNMPRQFAGWWLIDSAPVEVTRLTPGHEISRATINFSLVKHLDFNGKVRKTPQPRRPTGQKAKSGVTRYHTVVSGDWLSKIAQKYLGDMNRWREIYRLNKREIDRRGNPDLIFPGQRFKIPPK